MSSEPRPTPAGGTMTGIEIDLDRIDRRLDAIWDIGRTDQGGVTRLSYTPEETAAIEYVVDELDDRFAVSTDPIGNVFATTDPEAGSSLFVGSHLDTVFNGGRLDGALGVVAGLEAVEAALAAEVALPAPPTLCIFRAEESARFGQATVGSKGALGLLTVEDLSAVDRGGVPLWQAIREAGFRPANLSEPTVDVARVASYLELHIEQGRVLEESGTDVGVVTSIRAPVRFTATVVGGDDHSGATPMGMRRDAIAGAAAMITAVERIATDAAEDGDVVATVGDVTAPDGAINKVSGTVTFPIDIRSNDLAYRDQVETAITDALERVADDRDLELDLEPIGRSDPVELDGSTVEWLEDIASETGACFRCLPSGGGHDAMNFQTVGVPTGLLFVPSVDGVSHSPREKTSREAVRDATAVLARALLRGPAERP